MVVVEVEGVVVAVVGAEGWWLCLGVVVVDYYTGAGFQVFFFFLRCEAFRFVKHGIVVLSFVH